MCETRIKFTEECLIGLVDACWEKHVVDKTFRVGEDFPVKFIDRDDELKTVDIQFLDDDMIAHDVPDSVFLTYKYVTIVEYEDHKICNLIIRGTNQVATVISISSVDNLELHREEGSSLCDDAFLKCVKWANDYLTHLQS